jgi:putative phosphoesterase
MDSYCAKKVLVVSDSHGHGEHIKKALEMHPDADILIHLGDGASDLTLSLPTDYEKPIICAEGNCDYLGFYPIDRRFMPRISHLVEISGKRVFICHGHHYDVKSGVDKLALSAYNLGADIVLFGHTHLPYSEYITEGSRICDTITERPLLLFNPGTISKGYPHTFGILSFSGESVLASHGKVK